MFPDRRALGFYPTTIAQQLNRQVLIADIGMSLQVCQAPYELLSAVFDDHDAVGYGLGKMQILFRQQDSEPILLELQNRARHLPTSKFSATVSCVNIRRSSGT